MANISVQRDTSNLGLIDYALMGVGSSLAVWSAGVAIGQMPISVFSASLVLVGTMFSYGVRFFASSSKWIKIDGLLYTLVAIAAVIFNADLQTLMPAEGFPREVFAAGFLTWMLIFGGFVSWRDSTLLFQAVPAIALFGLIGCYDTYRNVVYPFYGFLVCLATFFARTHGRQMLHQAADSGFFTRGLAPGAPEPVVEVTPGLAAKMREGPWRWVAGPEWALGSALLIVLFSFIGTPVIQSSVQSVAGLVRVAPPTIRQPSTIPPVVNSMGGDSVRIGQGPAKLTDKPVLQATLDRPRYLRNGVYDRYTGGGWSLTKRADNSNEGVAAVIDLMDEASIHSFDYHLALFQRMVKVPIPGEPIQIPTSYVLRDGVLSSVGGSREISGKSIEVTNESLAKDSPKPLPAQFALETSQDGINSQVAELARDVTHNATTDFEKAQAIRNEVSRRLKYNINAAATPSGEDPVAYALFQQKEAYCDLFASSVVLMCRSIGIPARYATGFLTSNETDSGGGNYVVREKDAHAWAEVLFDKVGWVVFDATEGATEVDGGGVGSESATIWKAIGIIILDAMIVAIPVAALAGWWWTRRQKQLHPNYRGELDLLYLDFVTSLRKHSGIRRQLGTTGAEYMREVSDHLPPGTAEEANAIAQVFELSFYAPTMITADTLSGMRNRINQFNKAIKKAK